jgi:hypothetical protein
MRHLLGIALAIVMILTMFFAGAWGYLRLLRLPAPAAAPAAALPAQGGSLLSSGNVLAALGAVAVTGLMAGILIAVPRISPLAAGLAGLLLLGWTALYLVSVGRAVQLIPLRGNAFGAGWEGMLVNGILGGAGLAMIIPMFLPSRWRRADVADEAEEMSEASQYVADLKENIAPAGIARSVSPGISGPRSAGSAGSAGPRPPRARSPFPDR